MRSTWPRLTIDRRPRRAGRDDLVQHHAGLSPQPGGTRPSAAQELFSITIEPFLDDFVLERQLFVHRHALREGEPERILGEADHDLVLQELISERHEHLPAASGNAAILRVMAASVALTITPPRHQSYQ